MDIKYPSYILAIASRRNITKAAEDLFITQSTLSQYLSRLEREIGVPLFVRSRSELTPTPAGELYIDAAQRIVRIQEDLAQNIAALKEEGCIRVGVNSNWSLHMLTEIIPVFKAQYPGFTVEISELDLPGIRQLLARKDVDLALISDVTTEPYGDLTEILRDEEIFLAVPAAHAFAAAHPSGIAVTRQTVLEELGDSGILISRKGASLRILVDEFYGDYNYQPQIVCEVNSANTLRSMVANGDGFAFIAASACMDREAIAYYPLSPSMRRLNIVARKREWTMHAPERAFMELIRNYWR